MQKHENISKDFLKIFIWLLMILGVCLSSISVLAEGPWSIVHPIDPAFGFASIEIVHFRDARVGWAAGKDGWSGRTLILNTTDGGLTWQEELTDFPYQRAFFINALEGWTLLCGSENYTSLVEDIELYHSVDGGLTWQLQKGKITEFVNISNLEPANPFRSKALTQVYFIDSQNGWLLGHTSGEIGKTTKYVAGNVFLVTRDGGKTWSGQIDVFPTFKMGHGAGPETTIKLPIDIDFVSYTDGWILAAQNWLYRTTNGGKTWERLEHNRISEWRYIDFLDSQNGWLTGWAGVNDITGILFTQNGGDDWIQKAPILHGSFGPLYFTNSNEGWVIGTELISNIISAKRIFYTANGGDTWQLEWEIIDDTGISYIGYDKATSALWVGGTGGVLLKRFVNFPSNSVTPMRKLATYWGKIKKDIP